MTNKKIAGKKASPAKKDLAAEIADLLSPVKEVLKKILSDKKIEKRIKRAAKLLGHGIKQAASKKTPAERKPVKKAAKTKSLPATAAKKTVKKSQR